MLERGEELRRRDLERTADAEEIDERNVRLSPLDHADLVPVKVGPRAHLLLAQVSIEPNLTHTLSQNMERIQYMLLHSCIAQFVLLSFYTICLVSMRTMTAFPLPADLQNALATILRLEEQLREQIASRSQTRAMTLREICDLYFRENPRKVSDATLSRDRVNAANVCRLIGAPAPCSRSGFNR